MKQAHHHGHTPKHSAGSKHHHAHKHHPKGKIAGAKGHHHHQVHTVAKHPHHSKGRGLSLGDVACCTAEAVAASLRQAGRPVNAADVLALYRATAGHPGQGQSVWDALSAAQDRGLAGIRPVTFEPVELDDPAAVILGLELPAGAHTVAVGWDGCWLSWGEHFDPFPGAVVEEAWGITWP